MTLTQLEERVGTLGKPSKMPCHSTSISASLCKKGSQMAKVEGSVCFECYAMGGNYQYPSVKQAHQHRLEALEDTEWAELMAELITKREKSGFFRWHDSGDIQSVQHLANIVLVCELTPKISHWLPTREYGFVSDYIKGGGKVPSNLTIRLSALMIDSAPPKAIADRLGLCTSTVVREGQSCPAPNQANKCGECRACWDKNTKNVSYKLH